MTPFHVASIGWQPASNQPHFLGRRASASDVETHFADILRSWAADTAPKRRVLREVLEEGEAAVFDVPESQIFWNTPRESALFSRHANILMDDVAQGSVLRQSMRKSSNHLLLQPKYDAQFAEAVCTLSRGQLHGSTVTIGSARLERCFQNSGLEAATTGGAVMCHALHAHGWEHCAARSMPLFMQLESGGGCSGVCPPGLVSVNEGPESEGLPEALEAADDAAAHASAMRLLGVE